MTPVHTLPGMYYCQGGPERNASMFAVTGTADAGLQRVRTLEGSGPSRKCPDPKHRRSMFTRNAT